MSVVGYALLTLLPGLVWLWIFYRTDWYDPEPKRLVLGTFALGMVAVGPAFVAEALLGRLYPFLDESVERAVVGAGAAWPMCVGCFAFVGPAEELCKFLAVRLFAFRRPEFDEPLDGVVYAAAAALGFASVENVIYVIDWQTGLLRWAVLWQRTLMALPGHVIFATTWGYALGRRRFEPDRRVWPSVVGAALLHGLYDFLLMYRPLRPLVVLYMCLMVPVLLRQIRLLRAHSPFAPALAPPPTSPPPAACAAPERGAT